MPHQYCCAPTKCYTVLQSATPVPLLKYYCVLINYKGTSYFVLQSSYSLLQSATQVLLCPDGCHPGTTLYYKVLVSTIVLQSATQVLLCTNYKVLHQHYKVLLQYQSVLQSTTPVLLCTDGCYPGTAVLQSTTPIPLCPTE